jgi:hypothetical protein
VYEWRADDAEFAKAWKEACELGLDTLEYDVFSSGIPGNQQFILKARRNEVFGNHRTGDEQQQRASNFLSQITDEEHQRRLERYGLVQPLMIETDYEEDDVDVPTRAGNDSSSSTAAPIGRTDDDSS